MLHCHMTNTHFFFFFFEIGGTSAERLVRVKKLKHFCYFTLVMNYIRNGLVHKGS